MQPRGFYWGIQALKRWACPACAYDADEEAKVWAHMADSHKLYKPAPASKPKTASKPAAELEPEPES